MSSNSRRAINIFTIGAVTAAIWMCLAALAMCMAEASFAGRADSSIYLEVTRPKNSKMNVISVKWPRFENKGVSYYKLYCRDLKTKKLKMVKIRKSATSHTFRNLKTNRRYKFSLQGFNRKHKRIKSGTVTRLAGVEAPEFDFEYAGPCCHDKIQFDILYDDADDYSYKYIDVYRQAPGEKWKKVRTHRTVRAGYTFAFVDTDVTPLVSYNYRLRGRAVTTIKGRKKLVRSPFSKPLKIKAIDDHGLFDWSYIDEINDPAEASEITLECVMGEYNYYTAFNFDADKGAEAVAFADTGTVDDPLDYYDWVGEEVGRLKITEYNLDDKGWKKAKGQVIVKRGHRIGLRMKVEDNKTLDLTRDTVVSVLTGYGSKNPEYMTNFNIYIYKDSPKGTIRFLNAYYGYTDCGDTDVE